MIFYQGDLEEHFLLKIEASFPLIAAIGRAFSSFPHFIIAPILQILTELNFSFWLTQSRK